MGVEGYIKLQELGDPEQGKTLPLQDLPGCSGAILWRLPLLSLSPLGRGKGEGVRIGEGPVQAA